jgi:hypothetical protein
MSRFIFLYVAETDSEFALRCLGIHEGKTKHSALSDLLDVLEKQRFFQRIEQWKVAERRIAYEVDGEWEVDNQGNEAPTQRG